MDVNISMIEVIQASVGSVGDSFWIKIQCKERWAPVPCGNMVIHAPSREWAERLVATLNEREGEYRAWLEATHGIVPVSDARLDEDTGAVARGHR